jgi:hypothetical protein
MVKPSPRAPAPDAAPASARDWFLPAIEADGSVGDCLGAVLDELAARAAFVTAVRSALQGTQARGPDAVTDLTHRVRALENTLRFRVGVLRPDRPLAWFRPPAATSTGPFAATLIEEAIFAPYEVQDTERVRRELGTLWAKRADGPLPFRDGLPCLWRTLLSFNAELARLCRLGGPFDGLSLERLPDGLPPALESRALRAFLMNVRGEVLGVRERLQACFTQLWEASEKLWAVQLEQAKEVRQRERERERERTRPGAGAASADARCARSSRGAARSATASRC